MIGLSSYSLFSQHCPEIAIYRDNDQELNWGSNHYQRSTYCSLLGLAILAINEGGWAWGSDKVVPWLYHAFIIVYFLQVFGMLSHPLVTLLWAMEQASVHLFGGSPRASDLRILVSFVITSVFIAVPVLMLQSSTEKAARVVLVLLAFLSSHNFLGSFGIKEPFKKLNERL